MNSPPSPDPVPGSPSPPSSGLSRELAGQAGRWVLRLVLWGAAALAGWLIGGPLTLFGLGGVALALALALVAVAALVWRGAGLPLSTTAAALALSATVVAAQPARLDRSAGLLWAQPRTAQELTQGSPYVRGHGSVLVDLRRTNLPRGSVTDVRATSGDGRVIVALPHERCVAVDVTFRQVWMPDGIADLALAGVRATGAIGSGLTWGDDTLFEPPAQQPREEFSNLAAYGRNVAPITPARSASQQTWRWNRPVTQANPPLVRLHVEAAQQIFVRDYPNGAGPAFLSYDADQPEALGTGEQVADAAWPASVQLPRSPAEMDAAGAWHERARGTSATAQRRRWRAWAQRWVNAAARKANLAAGTCAVQETRATYWQTAEIDDAGSSLFRVVAVNALGDVRHYRSLGASYPDPTSLRTDPDPPAAFAGLTVDRDKLEVR